MHDLSVDLVLKALAETGRRLSESADAAPCRIVLCGAVAGMLTGELSADRRTLDCDVITSEPPDQFDAVAEAAAAVATQLDLSPQWLNADSRAYAHLLPLGWADRVSWIGRYGPLDVAVISRCDLLALKLMGVDQRPHDLEDLEAMKPSPAECDFLLAHLDRIECESLDRRSYEPQRSVLEELRRSW